MQPAPYALPPPSSWPGSLGVGAAAGLSACGLRLRGRPRSDRVRSPRRSPPARPPARVRSLALRARPVAGRPRRSGRHDLGVRRLHARARRSGPPPGDRVQVAFTNDLPEPTSVHWHGLAIRNDMDGVPGVTTPEVAARRCSSRSTSSSPTRARTGSTRTPDCSSTAACTRRSSSTTPPSPATTTPNGSSCSTTGPTASGPAPSRSTPTSRPRRVRIGDAWAAWAWAAWAGWAGWTAAMSPTRCTWSTGAPANDPDVLTAKPGQRVRLRIINAGADTIFTSPWPGTT